MDIEEKDKLKQKIRKINSVVGENYRILRKQHGLTQEKAAEISNVTTEYLCKFENGIYNARVNTLIDLCNSVGTTPTSLLKQYFETKTTGMVDLISNECSKLSNKDQKLVLDFIERLNK